MALEINTSLQTPSVFLEGAAAGVLTEDWKPASGNNLAYRRIIFGKQLGPVVLYDYKDTEHTFSLNTVLALGGVFDGQWSGVKAAGTTSYDITICK